MLETVKVKELLVATLCTRSSGDEHLQQDGDAIITQPVISEDCSNSCADTNSNWIASRSRWK